MTDKILQCCYTNASEQVGGRLSSGWKALAVSGDIPPEAYAKCVSLQNANSAIQTAMEDEEGNPLNLLELWGDGAYLYMMRTQYGLRDRLGRPNMFSHAFIFSWKDEGVVTDPNTFLTIADSNFKASEEEAAKVPAAFTRTAGFEPLGAMGAAGITPKSYQSLIRCVFAQMTEKQITEPLYVQYEDEGQIRAILYCIYYALPLYLRRSLCAASAAGINTASKNIVFSRSVDKHKYYVKPRTGENSVLSPRLERKIERYGFVDYVAGCAESKPDPGFFQRLEQMAAWLGDESASDELILKITSQMMDNKFWYEDDWTGYKDEDIDGRLSDTLRSRSGNEAMERYIASLLREACKRNLQLTDENEAYLAGRLNATTCDKLKQAAEQYNICRFSVLSPDDAARKLGQLDAKTFAQYVTKLLTMPSGPSILDAYFSDVALEKRSAMGWDYLEETLERSNIISNARPRTVEKAQALAWELYTEALEHGGDGWHALERYARIMERVLPSGEMAGCLAAAKQEYWQHVRFKDYDVDGGDLRRGMRVREDDRCEMFLSFDDLLGYIPRAADDVFLQYVEEYFTERSRIMGDEIRDAGEVLEKELDSHDRGGIVQWAEALVLAASVPDLGKKMLEVRFAACDCRWKDLPGLYSRFDSSMLYAREHRKLGELVGGLTMDICKDHDGPDQPVPLDVWLAVSKSRYGGSFAVFDHMAPEVLKWAAPDVVAESSLIFGEPYLSDARRYVQSKGEAAKAVGKWVNEVTQAEKRRKAGARKEGGPGGNLLGGIFSMLGQGGRDEDRPGQERKKDRKR